MPRAIIIAIGSEVTSGATVDTNSAFLSRELSGLGIDTVRHTAVKDDRDEIVSVLNQTIGAADIIITTGGLGPTFDDITKEVLSAFSDRKNIFNIRQFLRIKAYFRKRRKKIHRSAKGQAFFPEGCVIFDNPAGVAPGFGFAREGVWIAALPGVPLEMEAMFREEIRPFLLKQFPSETKVKLITARIIGMSEVEVLKKLGSKFPPRDKTVDCGIYPAAGEVTLRMTFKGGKARKIQSRVNSWTRCLQKKLSRNLISLSGESLESVIGKLLASNRQTLAVAESITGGLIAKRLTDIPGASRYFQGGAVVYSDQAKTTLLGLERPVLARYSAVSSQVAGRMAESIKKRFGTVWGLSVTGYAGPERGLKVGTVFIGLSRRSETKVRKYLFHGSRDRIRWLTSQAALSFLREALLDG